MEQLVAFDRIEDITNGDRDLEVEIASLFASTVADYVGALREAMDLEEEWQSVAHALKGASGNFGAAALAAAALAAEQESPSENRLGEIEALFQRTRKALHKQYGAALA